MSLLVHFGYFRGPLVAWGFSNDMLRPGSLLKFTRTFYKIMRKNRLSYRRIHADVIVYIFAHLHTALRIEGNMLDMN